MKCANEPKRDQKNNNFLTVLTTKEQAKLHHDINECDSCSDDSKLLLSYKSTTDDGPILTAEGRLFMATGREG